MNNSLNLNMNQTHLKYHSLIPRKGIYINCVKLLLVLSIYYSNWNRINHKYTGDQGQVLVELAV